MTLYAKYLVADQIMKRMERVGALPGPIYFFENSVHFGLAYEFKTGGYYDSAESRESIVDAFLEAFPDSNLARAADYSGVPQMIVSGTTSLGINWQIDFQSGVCEKVQVGTKKVQKYDTDALLALPMVSVEEPIYEYMCPDPLLAL